jgi:ATP/maltotriose-dependent transcriptional regulator MalT
MNDSTSERTDASRELARGREVYAKKAWDDAYRFMSGADQVAPLGPDDLERLAWSAALSGRTGESITLFERLHHRWLEAGEVLKAARAACWVGFRLLAFGEIARATGWLARCERLVEAHGEPCVERGYLLLPLAHRHFASGNLDAAYATAGSAAEIGDRFGDRDLAAFARAVQGRTLVRQGRLNDGLALLDEVRARDLR